MRRIGIVTAVLFLVEALCLQGLRAQATTSTLRGRVVDTDGTGLPGVVVVVASRTQPSGNKQTATDVEGNYRFQLLPPASDYMIKVNYPGFAKMEVGPIDLDAGKTTRADLTLRSAEETTETITITDYANIVDTDSTKTSSNYNSEFIEGLPIIGHNYQDILTLAPGVTDTDGDGNPNVHGSRDTGLQYRLDGGNITDPVSGTFGQNLNGDIIEEVEVITSGASAEYGRADGGFANIITKSGGNDFEGKFSIFWQGKFLNGDGADNNDTNEFENSFPNYRDIRPSLSLSGAVVRDNLWYFLSGERLDTERPINQIGADILTTSKGVYGFGKLTWQTNSFNKLTLQVTMDPRTFTGLGLALGVSPESDFEFEQGGVTPQLKWTSTISPQLLLEANITLFNTSIAVTPVSNRFEPTVVVRKVTNNTIQAQYPCDINNCNPERGERDIYQFDLITGRIDGPYFTKSDDSRIRNAIKTDLSYNIEDALGQHNIKAGFEFADEKFHDEPIINPFLLDVTQHAQPGLGGNQNGTENIADDRVRGFQVLTTFDPLVTPQNATSFNSGFYMLDAWKPRPNLTVNVGFRLDREDIDTSGFAAFDPRDERRQAIKVWRALCGALDLQDRDTANSNCHEFLVTPTRYYDGNPPNAQNAFPIILDDPSHPITDPIVRAMDLNGDGKVEKTGPDGAAFDSMFTRFIERETSNFEVVNTNFSPRFSVSWDPWADGKTKLFGNWSRYYDRLFLGTVTGEIGPDSVNYIFTPDPVTQVITHQAFSRAVSTISVTQIDRGLRTPYTDELSIGFERELAPEWSAGITYIKRKGYDLLQDTDFNHIICPEYRDEFGVDPLVICGDGARIELDKFGRVSVADGGNLGFFQNAALLPNGAPDLYAVNNNFNQILRIGNYNSYTYEAYEVKIVKRLHRNWQMQASYSWSKAFGQAESFGSTLGNDPQTTDDEAGYLTYDQRNLLRFQAVTRLPNEISLGAIVQWASGTPFSEISRIVDQDSAGNTIFRTFYPTGQRNDQRNEGIWRIDTRIEKNFVIGKMQAAAFLTVENLLDSDDLILSSYNIAAFNGIGLNGRREFGRTFEIGTIINF